VGICFVNDSTGLWNELVVSFLFVRMEKLRPLIPYV
jgi:hypothetical protein